MHTPHQCITRFYTNERLKGHPTWNKFESKDVGMLDSKNIKSTQFQLLTIETKSGRRFRAFVWCKTPVWSRGSATRSWYGECFPVVQHPHIVQNFLVLTPGIKCNHFRGNFMTKKWQKWQVMFERNHTSCLDELSNPFSQIPLFHWLTNPKVRIWLVKTYH